MTYIRTLKVKRAPLKPANTSQEVSLSSSNMDHRSALSKDEELEATSQAYPDDCSSDATLLPTPYQNEKFDEDMRLRSIRTWQYRAIGVVLAVLFVVFGIGSIFSAIFSHQPSSVPFIKMGECGRTTEEAQQNGCVFDLMMSGWVHPPCYDQELSDQFLRDNNFTFYRDREGLIVLPEVEARLGNYKVIYTHGTFHYQHCSYIWAKQMRAMRKYPFILDSKSRSREHIEHCYTRVGNPNISQVQLSTGTKLTRSTWRIDCIIGDTEVP